MLTIKTFFLSAELALTLKEQTLERLEEEGKGRKEWEMAKEDVRAEGEEIGETDERRRHGEREDGR